MRRAAYAVTIAALLSALALTGCGTGSTNIGKVAGAGSASSGKVASVRLTSSAIEHGHLASLYTCAGKNISPPLTWGAVPSAVRELALFALEPAPSKTGQLPVVEWVIAGVNPALHHINAGELPQGAFLLYTGTGKRKYSLCPPKGQTKHYEFALYALPTSASVTAELSGVALLTNLTNPNPEFQSPATGTIAATYTRR